MVLLYVSWEFLTLIVVHYLCEKLIFIAPITDLMEQFTLMLANCLSAW